MDMEYFKLNNGNEVPCICYGPGMITRGMSIPKNFFQRFSNKIKYLKIESQFRASIQSAINTGFCFIDYSAAYGREDIIRDAIQKSKLPREKFILTTRITNRAQFNGNVEEEFYRSIKRFGVNYIDLLMFHWPVTDKYIDTWKQMIQLQKKGLCRNIGVSNCNKHHIEALIEATGITPSINQVEIHPLFNQKELLTYSKEKGIILEAYTPLARMDERMTRLPVLKKIQEKYKKTLTQIILRWHIQNGVIPVFRSLNHHRILENYNIFDFVLTEEDMNIIDSININSRLRYDPDNCDFTIL